MGAALKLGVLAGAAAAFAGAAHARSGGGLPVTLADVHWSGGYTAASWGRAFLRDAGVPQTRCNLRFVLAWENAEGTYAAYRNPLDTTQAAPGSYAINSAGVQRYPSFAAGLRATVITLYNGRYPAIISALRAGNDAQAAADAVGSSAWGTAPFSASC